MTGTELKNNLIELSWSQSELARRLGVSNNTVSRWVGGVVPQYAAKYVGLVVEVRETLGALDALTKRREAE